MVQNSLEKPLPIQLPESVPNGEQATTSAEPVAINLPSLQIASPETPIVCYDVHTNPQRRPTRIQLQNGAMTDLDKWSQSVKLTDIEKSASQALQDRNVPFYQPDLFADKTTTRPNSVLIQICDRVSFDLVPSQQLILASYSDTGAAGMDKMASYYEKLIGRGEDLSLFKRDVQSTFKDADTIFKGWAERKGFSLTVLKTWIDLVQHGNRKHENESQRNYAPYLENHVYPFTKAIVMESHFPIVGALTKLWVRRYGHAHASMAHIWLEMILEEPKAVDNQALIQALTILYIYLEVDDHADATVHAVFRQAMKKPEEHLSRLKQAFYKGLAMISDSQLLDEPSRESLDKMKNFAAELKFKDDEVSHSGIMGETMGHLGELLQ